MPQGNFIKPKLGKNPYNFGRIVAEQDPELRDYYVDPERYVARALDFNDPAVFFIGPKGAGKSAILQMVRLTRAADESRIINISPDDLAFSALSNVSATTPILSEASKHQWLFKSLWDYILCLELLKREFKEKNDYRNYLGGIVRKLFGTQREAEARRLLVVSLGDEGQSQSLSARILQLVNEVELSAEIPEAVKLSTKVKGDGSKAGQSSQLWLLSLINNVAKEISTTVRSPYHILIDDLDLHWQDRPVQNAFIAALFFSLRNFSRPPYLKCAVAIRDQIYRHLPLVDRDKYHDWVCHVEWQEAHVKQMVEKRIASTLDILKSDIWGGLFPANAFQRLVRHTYGRPRESIRLASMCVAEAVRKGHGRVEEEDLSLGLRKFSDSRITEVASEYEAAYPGLGQIIRKFTGFAKEFPIDQLKGIGEEAWLERECGDESASEYAWAAEFAEDPVAFARALLECGVLLYKRDRTQPPDLYDLDKRPEVNHLTWLAIHPAFIPALETDH